MDALSTEGEVSQLMHSRPLQVLAACLLLGGGGYGFSLANKPTVEDAERIVASSPTLAVIKLKVESHDAKLERIERKLDRLLEKSKDDGR